MASGTVRTAASVETWTSFVKASFGALGLALLATGPFIPRPEEFPVLPVYAYVAGGLLVVLAATMRLRSILVVLGCLALTAALSFTLVGDEPGPRNLASLLLYSAAGLLFGAVGRAPWMALPFLLVPVLVVAPTGADWSASRESFAAAWAGALECDCLLAGLPASLAVAGASIGQFRRHGWPDLRPSALPLLVLCAGLLFAGLILGSLLPDEGALATARLVCLRAALLAGVLGWVGLAYQVGRLRLVWEAALACLLLLAGALFLDRATQFPQAFGPTLLLTVASSLVPAVLAGVGLLVRKWIGKERPKAPAAAAHPPTSIERSFFAAAPPPVETGASGSPLHAPPEPSQPPAGPKPPSGPPG